MIPWGLPEVNGLGAGHRLAEMGHLSRSIATVFPL